MATELISVGFGNVLAANRIIAIVSPGSAPIKRLVQEAEKDGHLIDMTSGRRTRAVLVLDSGHIAKVAILPSTIATHLNSSRAAAP